MQNLSKIGIIYLGKQPRIIAVVRKDPTVIIWPDIEDRLDAFQAEAEAVGDEERERAEFFEEMERPLRSRLATAFVQIAVKLDPQAAERINSEAVEA
jgi:hypothetical protein